MAPGLWSKMSGVSSKKGEMKARAHGDGLDVSYDSPEALDEVFWWVFSGDDYIRDDRLLQMAADDEAIEKYRLYITATLRHYGAKRYAP